jgi:c-di-GMP-related signal transduction protein
MLPLKLRVPVIDDGRCATGRDYLARTIYCSPADLRCAHEAFGYELLFRDGPKNSFSPSKHASSSLIVDSTMLYSLDALIGSAKAFINLDLGALTNGAALFLPPERTVIEILESVEPTAEVIAACQNLCDRATR